MNLLFVLNNLNVCPRITLNSLISFYKVLYFLVAWIIVDGMNQDCLRKFFSNICLFDLQ